MTNPDDKNGKPGLTPQGNAPSWVDEVLGGSKTAPTTPTPTPSPPLSGTENLKIPETRPATPPSPATGQDDWISRATGGQVKDPQLPSGLQATSTPTRSSADVLSDFVRPLTERHSPAIENPVAQPIPGQAVHSQPMTYADPAQPLPFASGDVSQKKLIAGLLAIFVGSLGVHKFYLGMTNPGLLLLGTNIGVWILALILGLLTLGIGLVVTLPLAILVSSALAVLGLVEGILYLTKTDADFQREYLIGKKPWL